MRHHVSLEFDREFLAVTLTIPAPEQPDLCTLIATNH